jgi:hypothetical protein
VQAEINTTCRTRYRTALLSLLVNLNLELANRTEGSQGAERLNAGQEHLIEHLLVTRVGFHPLPNPMLHGTRFTGIPEEQGPDNLSSLVDDLLIDIG